MTGITQMVLTQSEPIVGFRGKIVNSNSLVFGETAGELLVVGDTAKMSSLNVANLPAIGTQSFTIEYWVRFSNVQWIDDIVHVNGQAIIGSGSLLGGLAILHVQDAIYINNYLITNNRITIPSQAIPGQVWQAYTWYHIAICRNGVGQLAAWINGYRSPENLFENLNNYNLPPTLIGTWRNALGVGVTNNLIGKLYNLSITIGSTLYNLNDAVIQIPKYPLSTTANSKLLMTSPTGQILYDASATSTVTPKAGTVTQTKSTAFNDAITLSGCRLSSSSPFTGNQSGSILLNGASNSSASFPGDSGMSFGTNDFVIEWFAYSSDNNQSSSPWWYGTTSNPTLGISFSISGLNADILLHNGATTTTLATVAKSSYYKLWTHWAIVRRSGQVYIFRNGSLLNGAGVALTTSLTDTSSTFTIGKQGPTSLDSGAFGGYLTNLRIIKGIGVYTGSFTVPTSNLQRIQSANPFGGSNTLGLRSEHVPYLIVP